MCITSIASFVSSAVYRPMLNEFVASTSHSKAMEVER
jgi:hypothetical protein